MVRGPHAGNGKHSRDHFSAKPLLSSVPTGAGTLSFDDDDPWDADPATGGTWSGSGGRWRLWPLRVVLWLALLVIAYRGVTAIVLNQTVARQGGGASSSANHDDFPVALAEAYAAQFAQVYLNFSPAIQAQREQELAAFLPAGVAAANPDLGWNGAGQMSLQSEQVAGIAIQDGQHAVVTVLATVNGQLMELGVPVIAAGGGVVVAGEPAWLPAPPPISPPPTAVAGTDPVAQSELMTELPAFFQAYANGDGATLNRFAAPGASLTGLGGAVTFDSIAGLHVPPGGAMRQITVTVIWQLPSQVSSGLAKITMTYRVSVVAMQSGKWYVLEISASTEAVGAK